MLHNFHHQSPYSLLAFGLFLVLLAAIYLYMGKAWIRFNGWVYLAEEPKRYWLEVGTYVIIGFLCVGWFFYKVH